MVFSRRALFVTAFICAINTALGSDQRPGLAAWTRSTFYKFINRHKMQKDGKVFVDRRAVALDAIEDDIRPKGLWRWVSSLWSRPLYELPIVQVEAAEVDTAMQKKANEMAKQGGYYVPQRRKEGTEGRPFYFANDILGERRDNTKKFGREAALKMELDMLQTEPDPFLQLKERGQTLGELLQTKKRQQLESGKKSIVPIVDELLDYKLGKTKQKEEFKLLDDALHATKASGDVIYKEQRKLSRQAENAIGAASECKFDYEQGQISDNSPCKMQERYYKELIDKNHNLNRLQEINKKTEEQLLREREKLQRRKEVTDWIHMWSRYEQREAGAATH